MDETKKTYSVRIPITGWIGLEVEADSADDAITQALESDDVELLLSEVEQWEATRQIVRGNIFYGLLNEAEATEV